MSTRKRARAPSRCTRSISRAKSSLQASQERIENPVKLRWHTKTRIIDRKAERRNQSYKDAVIASVSFIDQWGRWSQSVSTTVWQVLAWWWWLSEHVPNTLAKTAAHQAPCEVLVLLHRQKWPKSDQLQPEFCCSFEEDLGVVNNLGWYAVEHFQNPRDPS